MPIPHPKQLYELDYLVRENPTGGDTKTENNIEKLAIESMDLLTLGCDKPANFNNQIDFGRILSVSNFFINVSQQHLDEYIEGVVPDSNHIGFCVGKLISIVPADCLTDNLVFPDNPHGDWHKGIYLRIVPDEICTKKAIRNKIGNYVPVIGSNFYNPNPALLN